jgi:hypothetical protein
MLWPPFAAPAAVAVPAALPPAFAPADEEPALPAAPGLTGGPPSEEEQAKAAPQQMRTAETDANEEIATAKA